MLTPPSELGALNTSSMLPLPAVTLVRVGAPGAVLPLPPPPPLPALTVTLSVAVFDTLLALSVALNVNESLPVKPLVGV